MTCPLKVNIKSEIWVIYGVVLHRHGNQIERSAPPGISKSKWVSAQAWFCLQLLCPPPLTVLCTACPLEPRWGWAMHCFQEKLLPRGHRSAHTEYTHTGARWQYTYVCVCAVYVLLYLCTTVGIHSVISCHATPACGDHRSQRTSSRGGGWPDLWFWTEKSSI